MTPLRGRSLKGERLMADAPFGKWQTRTFVEKLRRVLYGNGSERKARLLEQMELQLEELEPTRRRPKPRRSNPSSASVAQAVPRAFAARARGDHGAGQLPMLRLGEAVEAGRGHHRDAGGDPAPLEGHQTVREKFTCGACESITQPPAPFHVTPRGFAGPNLLAMILFDKFGQQSRSTGRATASPMSASTSASRHWPIRSGLV
jgi:transposase